MPPDCQPAEMLVPAATNVVKFAEPVDDAGPAGPEPGQGQGAGALVLAQDEGRDEEARQREEQRHAEEAPGQEVGVVVVEEDGGHREPPEGVDGGPPGGVALHGSGRTAGRRPPCASAPAPPRGQ